MKTFSRLSLFMLVCLGVMLVGKLAVAVDPSIEGSVTEGPYEVGRTVTVIFEVSENDVPLLITGSGVQVHKDKAKSVPVKLGDSYTTAGMTLVLHVTIIAPNAHIAALWDRPAVDADKLYVKIDLLSYELPPTIINCEAPEPCDDHDHVALVLTPLTPDVLGLTPDARFNPKTVVKVGDVFKQRITITNASDLAAWQMEVVFNPHILEVVSVEEGDFLEGGSTLNDETDNVDALFLASDGEGWIPVKDHTVGDSVLRRQLSTQVAEGTVAASQARIERGAADQHPSDARRVGPGGLRGVTGSGDLMSICFRVLEFGEEPLGIHNVQLSDSNGDRLSYSIRIKDFIVVTHKFPAEDVNRDGYVNIQDLVLVASNIGLVPGNLHNPKADTNADAVYGEGDGVRSGMYTEFGPPNNAVTPDLVSVGDSHSRVDVNNDGIVNILDLIQVAMSPDWGGASTLKDVRNANVASLSAPSMVAENLAPATIQAWIDLAQVEHDGSSIFEVGIANLESLLVSRIPSETKLLLNYPNPFNPETWIPYQLAETTEVTVMIYTMNGSLVRTLALGHQAAGTYKSKSQAAYWDGRNELGEQVASGLYFYTLTAGDFSATGKMLIRK